MVFDLSMFLVQTAIVVFVFIIPINRGDPTWFFEAIMATFGGFFIVDLRPSILQKWRLANSCLALRALNSLRFSQRIQILWYLLLIKDIEHFYLFLPWNEWYFFEKKVGDFRLTKLVTLKSTEFQNNFFRISVLTAEKFVGTKILQCHSNLWKNWSASDSRIWLHGC